MFNTNISSFNALALAIFSCVVTCVPSPVVPRPDAIDGNTDSIVMIQDAAITDISVAVNITDAQSDSKPIQDVSVVDVIVSDVVSDSVSGLDSASSTCAKACSNLVKLGCPEGKDENCVVVCDHVSQTHLVKFDAKCLSTAKDVKAAKACGSITCNIKK